MYNLKRLYIVANWNCGLDSGDESFIIALIRSEL